VTASKTYDVAFCDTCIGGSTVAANLSLPGLSAFYLADYAVNPLGTRSDREVRAALVRWLGIAESQAPVIVVACNTASVRLEGTSRPSNVFTMVDLFDSALAREREHLAGKRVCVMGTEFTVASPVYAERLDIAKEVIPLGATLTERTIAHLEHTTTEGRRTIADEIAAVIRTVDAVAHVCTCFPLIADLIADINPHIHQLDPGRAIRDIADWPEREGENHLTVAVTGDSVSAADIRDHAAELFPGWDRVEVLSRAD
jgi:glutamate racemase